jgi:ketosteroid isomerase-like protein
MTISGSGVLKGRAAIEAHEADLLRQFPGARLGLRDIWQNGSLAVVHYAVNGRTPSGQAMGHEGLLFFRFHTSGLIIEERRYNDSMTPMAQLGMLGSVPARSLSTLPIELNAHTANGSPHERANVALVRASFAALDAKNDTAFLANIAEDAVIDEMIELEPSAGKQNVEAWFQRWTTAIPDARTEITTILGVRDFVLVECIVRGTLKAPLGRVMASDKPFSVHRAAIVQIKDRKLTRLTGFMNGKELAEAVGQWPPADH